jgi:hypothetical protein
LIPLSYSWAATTNTPVDTTPKKTRATAGRLNHPLRITFVAITEVTLLRDSSEFLAPKSPWRSYRDRTQRATRRASGAMCPPDPPISLLVGDFSGFSAV